MGIFHDTLAEIVTDSVENEPSTTREDWERALDIAFGKKPQQPDLSTKGLPYEHKFVVTVEGVDAEKAGRIMDERISHDEEYDFLDEDEDYEIGYRSAE